MRQSSVFVQGVVIISVYTLVPSSSKLLHPSSPISTLASPSDAQSVFPSYSVIFHLVDDVQVTLADLII